MAYRNYSLVYRSGYRHSQHDCLICHHITGPFIADTDLLRQNPLDIKMADNLVFYDLFFRIFQKGLKLGVCPDSMFIVRDEPSIKLSRMEWLPLVKKHQINQIITPEGTIFSFTCQESGINLEMLDRRDFMSLKGYVMPPCMLKSLADHIKFVMRVCAEHNIFCEINGGTCSEQLS